jgi:hypothetical protein
MAGGNLPTCKAAQTPANTTTSAGSMREERMAGRLM